MAQSGYTPISIYYSATATNVPLAANLTSGELGINIADGKLYYKDNAGVVKLLASNGASTPVTSFQTSLGGLTPSTATTGVVTLAGTLNTSSGGTGLTTYTAGDLPYYASGTALSKLAIGTTGQILTSTGTGLQWTSLSSVGVTTISFGSTGLTPSTTTTGAVTVAGTLVVSNGGTGQTTLATGSLGYGQGTSAHAALAIGTAGQVLTVNSGATAPQWVNASSIIVGAGGSNTQVQYNSSGSLAGSANLTFNGTTLTTANDASISGLTVGKGGGAQARNTAFGLNTLLSNTTGNINTAVGNSALYSNTTGANNTAAGDFSLVYNTTGSYNTSFGQSALQANTTASNNTAIGYQAGYSNTTGAYNVFLGYQAGYGSNYNGNALNVCVGNASGYGLTTGNNNTFIGSSTAGYYVTTGSKNSILGSYNGNQGGLDIRTASNYIVLSDGDGNPRGIFDGSGNFLVGTTTAFSGSNIVSYYAGGNNFAGVTAINNNGGTGIGGIQFGSDSTYVKAAIGLLRQSPNGRGILAFYNSTSTAASNWTTTDEKMRIDESGNLCVATTNSTPGNGTGNNVSGFAANANGTTWASRSGFSALSVNRVDTTGDVLRVASAGNQVGSISVTSVATLYNTTSDYRLKDVVSEIFDSGSRIDALQPINYTMKTDGSAQRGFLAHQFQAIYPNSVSGEKDAVDVEGKPVYQAMQASSAEVMADLIAEIQSLRKRIATLEAK